MHRENEDKLDPNQPALTVLVGVTRRKRRPLVGDVVMIGRAPGCDIGLVSPDVAPVHCLILRQPSGWRIRDCSGRATRVNGKAIQDEALHNGDTIQIGAFSFEVSLPPSASIPVAAIAPESPVAANSGRLEKLEQSRRRFARRALALRARLREQSTAADDLDARHHELGRLEARIRATHQEQATALAQERAALDARQQQLEARAGELDAFARHLRQQAQQARPAADPSLAAQRQELDQMRRDLETRQAELEIAAAQLHETFLRDTPSPRRPARDEETNTPTCGVNQDSHHDGVPNRLEAARRLLRELEHRRKVSENLVGRGTGSAHGQRRS